MYQYYGELPSDINIQDDTVGPPPAFFRPSGLIFNGYGESKTIEASKDLSKDKSHRAIKKDKVPVKTIKPTTQKIVRRKIVAPRVGPRINPVKIIHHLKYNQEMPSNIPSVATRYTEVSPLSPMFRSDPPKYGFGEFNISTTAISLIGISIIALITCYIFCRK